MAVPKRRTGKTRKRKRRTHFKLKVEGLTTCSNCGTLIPSHTVCPECGFYKGEEVIVKNN
ncbi:MAG: 50S ribosomal protein L32 [Erysipelotrichaceae bacterium]|nr:50S ribosomal protein L32 [Erysipelotrichaceae bacterium]